MISGIKGRLVFMDENKAEVDTGAFTLDVFVPATLFVTHSKIGEEITLFTHLYVKEDEMSLYGFETREELKIFKMLIGVSGIGPKSALSILSYLTPEKLAFAIVSKDIKSISRANGIGKKGAERICIDLKDKMESMIGREAPDGTASEHAVSFISPEKEDAILALTELGFSHSAAYQAVSGLPDGLDSSSLLNKALRMIGR